MCVIFKDILNGKYRNVWIYGAGQVGKKLLVDFGFFHIPIEGIVMSKYDGTVIPGIQICSLSEIKTPPKDSVFIITSSAKFHNEIIKNIQESGYENYIIWNVECLCSLWRQAEYHFTDRRKSFDKCCFILAGYKEFLWKDVFERFTYFIPKDIDVCILSSGIHSEKLEMLAEKNSWSYLYTKINSVTLIQNIAFSIFEKYNWIYKVDEDMFITEGSFEGLFDTYQKVEKELQYEPGIVAPLIPVNGYGYSIILYRLGKMSDYENKFGKIVVGGNPESMIEKNPETAVFMWRECPQIDDLNRFFSRETQINLCSVRLSIGFILLKHFLWEDMQGFSVSGNADMGTDEVELCSQCINKSKAIIISTSEVVGHFSFGKQTDRMKEFYIENPNWFKINVCHKKF